MNGIEKKAAKGLQKASSINLRQYSMLIALVAIVIFFQIATKGILLVPMNISNLIAQNAYVVILAIGMLICILTGGNIDLSVGSVVAIVGAVAGKLVIEGKGNVYTSAGICLLLGLVIGAWQGFWVAYVRIPAFIVTLAGMLIFRGLTLTVLGGLTIAPFPEEYMKWSTGFLWSNAPKVAFLGKNFNIPAVGIGAALALGYCLLQVLNYRSRRKKGYEVSALPIVIIKTVAISGVLLALFAMLAQYRGIPTVLVLLGLLLMVYTLFTNNTVMGRHIYAIGGNEKAARLSGVKTNGMLFLAYVNMGLLSAVAGLVFAARLNSASPQAGQSFELDAIAACYIGGASAYGGIGTVGGTLIGALIMGVLNNGMSIVGIPSSDQMTVKGCVLLAAVAFDVISKKQTALPSFPNPFRRKEKVAGALER